MSIFSISQVCPFVQGSNKDVILVHSGLVSHLHTRKTKVPCTIFWTKPINGYVKLNMDGSSLGNPGFSGGSGVIRDMVDNVLFGFAVFMGLQYFLGIRASPTQV